jgi:hypothetical protein
LVIIQVVIELFFDDMDIKHMILPYLAQLYDIQLVVVVSENMIWMEILILGNMTPHAFNA